MDVDPRLGISQAAPGSQGVATAGNPNLGKDEFVKLLMAQLGNQDPTAPQDSSAFVAQLAQFAHVELAQNANSQLEAILVAQASNNQTATTQLVGKEVLFMSDSVTVTEDHAPDVVLDLGRAAQTVNVRFLNDSGEVVSERTLQNVPGGRTSVAPVGPDGRPLPPGTYRVEVEALDAQGNNIEVIQAVRGHVEGVSFAEGYAQLLVGGTLLSLADVIEVHEAGDGNVAPTTAISSGAPSGASARAGLPLPYSRPLGLNTRGS